LRPSETGYDVVMIEHYQALRAENARLREALTLCIERLEGLKEDGITKAEQAALDSAHAALQPERGSHEQR